MLRGEIRLVSLDPGRGSEASTSHPAVIVSNDGANGAAARLSRGVVTVVPVTSNVTRIYPFQVVLRSADTGLQRDAKARAEQVRSVDVDRVGPRLGVVPAQVMARLDAALRLHLSL